jgi:hypothetical protein
MNRARKPQYWCADIPPERDVANIMPPSRNGKTFETVREADAFLRSLPSLPASGTRNGGSD